MLEFVNKEKEGKMEKLNESRENDLFFEFLNFDERDYYHMGDSYGEGRSLDTFLEDVKDFSCDLYIVGFDSGSYDFILATESNSERNPSYTESKVLEDFSEMLSESERYGYQNHNEEDGEEYEGVSLDVITKLDMGQFVEITFGEIDNRTFETVKKDVWNLASLENALEDSGYYREHNFKTSTKTFGVIEFIQWCEKLDNKFTEKSTITHNVLDDCLEFTLSDDYETKFYSIGAPAGQYLKQKMFERIFNFITKEIEYSRNNN